MDDDVTFHAFFAFASFLLRCRCLWRFHCFAFRLFNNLCQLLVLLVIGIVALHLLVDNLGAQRSPLKFAVVDTMAIRDCFFFLVLGDQVQWANNFETAWLFKLDRKISNRIQKYL